MSVTLPDKFCVYTQEIKTNLPRLLALFDMDSTSKSVGMGDRFYWAWGLIDFNNVAFQGAVNGMVRLWTTGLWPYNTDPDFFWFRINTIFGAVARSTHADGSIDQAFPNEGSYALTGFVAYDLLCCLDLAEGHAPREYISRWVSVIEPLINFLIASDETHGLISNHLAGVAAALFRWHKAVDDVKAENKALILLKRILSKQSSEGWFVEYEGADPGYQTLCTYYLADIHKLRPELMLLGPLRRSIQFLWQFAHPDGSFGGLYGSRCTRFYHPAGIKALASEITEAKHLSLFMEASIAKHKVISLSAIDETNLIPMFNAYAWAASENLMQSSEFNNVEIPAQSSKPFRIWFKEAGLLVDHGIEHHSVISTHKGGVTYHFIDSELVLLNPGVVIKSKKGKLGSTQSFCSNNFVDENGPVITVESLVTAMPKDLPGPWQFLIIRCLSISLFKSRRIREKVKQLLVKLLITRKSIWPIMVKRSIILGKDLELKDSLELPKGYQQVSNLGYFVPIHMASQGYWQSQDEVNSQNIATTINKK